MYVRIQLCPRQNLQDVNKIVGSGQGPQLLGAVVKGFPGSQLRMKAKLFPREEFQLPRLEGKTLPKEAFPFTQSL